MLTQMDEVGTDIQPHLKGAPKSSKACLHCKQRAPSGYFLIFFLFSFCASWDNECALFFGALVLVRAKSALSQVWAAFYHKYFIMIIPFSQNSKYFEYKYLLKSCCG